MADPRPQEHLPLSVPVYQILLSLADRELHGYAMIQEIRERTEGEVDLTPSTLYGAVKRLEEDGLIAEAEERLDPLLDDSRRRYYRITPVGREVARAEARRLERALQHARSKGILGDGAAAEEGRA